MPNIRIALTVDTLANILYSGAGASLMSLTNLELCYDVVKFGPEINSLVANQMVDQEGAIYLKSQSYGASSQTLANGTQGLVELVYGQRYSSIKALFASFASTKNSLWSDSVDITSGNGDLSFSIQGRLYPDRPISTVLNKAGALMELLAAWGPVHGVDSSNCAIVPIEFTRVSGDASAPLSPGKFWLGVNTERLSTGTALLSGTSTANSPITIRINLGTATADVHNITVIALYDALIKIIPSTKQTSVIQ